MESSRQGEPECARLHLPLSASPCHGLVAQAIRDLNHMRTLPYLPMVKPENRARVSVWSSKAAEPWICPYRRPALV